MLTLSSDSLEHYGLNRIFSITKDAGYEGVDLVLNKNMDTKDPEYLMELSAKYQLPITSISTGTNATKKEAIELLKVAKDANIRVVIIYPPSLMDFSYVQWIKNDLPILMKRNELMVAMVNAPANTIFGVFPERAMNNFQDLSRFGALALDISNLETQRMNPLKVYTHFQKDIIQVYFSNYHKGLTHMLPENGILPLESFLAKLHKTQYRGNISVRLRPSELTAASVAEVVEKLQNTKAFIEKYYTS